MCYAEIMKFDRFSITMDPDLGAAVREAAQEEGVSVSAWLSGAAAARLRNHLLGRALDRWEAEIGPPTEEELDAAAEKLGLARTRHGS
jgi:hypothetical protein